MKRILLLLIFILPLILTNAQVERGENLVQKVNMALGIDGDGVKDKVMYFQVPFKNESSFSTLAFKFFGVQQGSISMEIAYADKAGRFTDWEPLVFEDHLPAGADYIVTKLQIIDAEYERLRVRINTPLVKKFKSEAHWYLPPSEFGLDQRVLPQANLAANCVLPSYVTRTGWNCPSGQAFTSGNPTYINVTHLAVHHTAGSNVTQNWAARVLAVWNYHVNTNGYSDIAYNFMIDPNGVIYEGRGGSQGYTLDVLSAATCGSNYGSMSICVIGNYELVEPSAAVLASLESLLAWKSDKNSINPVGSSSLNNYGVLDHVFGHRQGCATACPGENLYVKLPSLRLAVDNEIINGCEPGVPSIVTGTLTLDDNNAGDSEGNEDGLVNSGETIEMYLTLTNDGTVPLNNLTATISTNDPCVSYIDDDIAYGNLAIGATSTQGDFDVVFGANCTGDIEFTITYTFDGGTLTETVIISIEDENCPEPVVNFVSDVTSGVSPLVLKLTNTTTGAQGYNWTVTSTTGSETHSSNVENPTFILVNSGLYDITQCAYNECGENCMTRSEYIEVFEVTDVTDESLLVASIYPNPVKRKLNIALKQVVNSGEITIINAAGQEVYTGSFSGNQTQINVRDLASGTYILQIVDNANPNQKFNHTFVKKS